MRLFFLVLALSLCSGEEFLLQAYHNANDCGFNVLKKNYIYWNECWRGYARLNQPWATENVHYKKDGGKIWRCPGCSVFTGVDTCLELAPNQCYAGYTYHLVDVGDITTGLAAWAVSDDNTCQRLPQGKCNLPPADCSAARVTRTFFPKTNNACFKLMGWSYQNNATTACAWFNPECNYNSVCASYSSGSYQCYPSDQSGVPFRDRGSFFRITPILKNDGIISKDNLTNAGCTAHAHELLLLAVVAITFIFLNDE